LLLLLLLLLLLRSNAAGVDECVAIIAEWCDEGRSLKPVLDGDMRRC
jgi:hypothetical protein